MGPLHLALSRLTKQYGATAAVADVSLEVAQGELVALLGPSGCGKTTTLRMIVGLVVPTAGDVILLGRRITGVPPYQRDMGMVYQHYALFPHLNVAQNVAFGLEMRQVPQPEIRARVAEALALVRLENFEGRRIRELSGGQQQRVALARALVIKPAVLLLDEPLSNLDAKLREEMRGEIREIQRRLGITTVFVTHDQVEALTMADRVAVMNRGRLEQVGTPEEIYERPVSRFVASFIGRANFIPARVVRRDPGGARLETPEGVALPASPAPPGASTVAVMVRPHRIRLVRPAAGGGLHGRIQRITYLGDLTQYELAAGDVALVVEQPTTGDEISFRIGDDVGVQWRSQDALVFAG